MKIRCISPLLARGSKSAALLKDIPLSFVPSSGPTFHFNRGINLTPAIDHILHTADLTPLRKVTVTRKKYNGQWPSDHYPVTADFTLTK